MTQFSSHLIQCTEQLMYNETVAQYFFASSFNVQLYALLLSHHSNPAENTVTNFFRDFFNSIHQQALKMLCNTPV